MSEPTENSGQRVPVWLWPNVLGLDAPLVAVAWQHLFAATLGLKLRPIEYAVLALVVWVIYSIDRLVDARRLGQPESAAHRHRFYRDHFGLMALLTALGAAVAAWQILTVLPGKIIRPGIMLSMFVLVYLFHRIWVRGPILAVLPKEIFSGFVFALGATLIGFTWTADYSSFFSAEVFWFGVLCAMNCVAISVWERGHDKGNDPNAIAQLWPWVTPALAYLSWATAAAATTVAFLARYQAAFPLLAASATGLLLLAGLASFASRLRPASLRVYADAAVLLPAIAFVALTPWDSTA